MISCNKDINQPVKPVPIYSWEDTVVRNVAVNGTSFMAFETVDVWENTLDYLYTLSDSLLDLWNYSYSFTSLRQVFEDDTLDQIPIEDPFLATALNEDCLVQIGEKLYKINVTQELVYVLNEINDDNVSKLLNEEIEPGTIDTYNVMIEVLHLEEMELKRTAPVLKQTLSCGEKGVKGKKKDIDYYDYSIYKTKFKVVYQPVGIWFSLFSEIKHRAKGGGNKSAPTDLAIASVGTWHWKPRCQSDIPHVESTGPFYWHKLHIPTYHKTRSLHQFNLTVAFFCHEIEGTPGLVRLNDLEIEGHGNE